MTYNVFVGTLSLHTTLQAMMPGWSAWGLLTDKTMKAKCIVRSPTVAPMWNTQGQTEPQTDSDAYCLVVESQATQ